MVKASSYSNNFFKRQFPVSLYSNRRSSIVIYVILATMVVDTILNQHEGISVYLKTHGWDIVLFVVLAALSICGQFYVLEFVKQKSRDIRNKVPHISISHKITTFLQYLVIADFVFLIFGMLIFSQYPTLSLALITASHLWLEYSS